MKITIRTAKEKKEKRKIKIADHCRPENMNAIDYAMIIFIGAWISARFSSWYGNIQYSTEPLTVTIAATILLLVYIFVVLGLCKSLHETARNQDMKYISALFPYEDYKLTNGQRFRRIFIRCIKKPFVFEKRKLTGTGRLDTENVVRPVLWIVTFIACKIIEITTRVNGYNLHSFSLCALTRLFVDGSTLFLLMIWSTLFLIWYVLTRRFSGLAHKEPDADMTDEDRNRLLGKGFQGQYDLRLYNAAIENALVKVALLTEPISRNEVVGIFEEIRKPSESASQ